MRVEPDIVHTRERRFEVGETEGAFADRTLERDALLVRLRRLLVRNVAVVALRRAERETEARRRHVVDRAEFEVEIGKRAGLRDVHIDAGLDIDLRLLREVAAVLEVEDVHRQRDREVIVDLIRE